MRMITMVLKSHICGLQICVHKYCSKTSFYLCIHAHCLKLHKYATKIYIMGVVDSSVVCIRGPIFYCQYHSFEGGGTKVARCQWEKTYVSSFHIHPIQLFKWPNTQYPTFTEFVPFCQINTAPAPYPVPP